MLNLACYTWRETTLDDLLFAWPVIAIAGGLAIFFLVGKFREDRKWRRKVASWAVVPAVAPAPAVYTRDDWKRDMLDPDLSIEEISVRVVRSDGSWRIKPAPLPDPSSPTHPQEFPCAGGGLGLSGGSIFGSSGGIGSGILPVVLGAIGGIAGLVIAQKLENLGD